MDNSSGGGDRDGKSGPSFLLCARRTYPRVFI
jgi:hypothetical protein